jgi:hypothetical protein
MKNGTTNTTVRTILELRIRSRELALCHYA